MSFGDSSNLLIAPLIVLSVYKLNIHITPRKCKTYKSFIILVACTYLKHSSLLPIGGQRWLVFFNKVVLLWEKRGWWVVSIDSYWYGMVLGTAVLIILYIEELKDRREGKGRLWFFGYLMQLEGEGGVVVRQSCKKRLLEIWWDLNLGPSDNWIFNAQKKMHTMILG